MAVRNSARSGYVVLGACALLLSACATGPKGHVLDGKADYKDAVGVFTSPEADPNSLDPVAAAAYWGSRYDAQPQSAETAVRYSAALRKIGSVDEAITVATKAAELHADDPSVNLEVGKALVEGGRAFEAVRYLEKATAKKSNDWRALSAYGVALDQIGEHDTAREKYDAALEINPSAVTVMNNKGLSYAMSGQLDMAIKTLRVAAAEPGSDARVRQNLALALAIKGDYPEAVRLARSDLPPQIADNNAAYYKALLNQPAYWQSYADDQVKTPDFDAAPASAAPDKAPSTLTPPKENPKPSKDKAAPVALGAPATPATKASATVAAPAGEDAAPDLKSN
ncbi:MAG: tetratricopeptide repeat protein [Alphaproteobacteria bacterium]|nr:tetratricopeptide repeat protein [Alphaproteobacteria bacterium]